jgi:hypothetical protein
MVAVIGVALMTPVSSFAVVGDQDGDGDVDQSDIDTILAARNTPADPNDPRDLDGDGMITVLDARIAAACCTRDLCVVEDIDPKVTPGATATVQSKVVRSPASLAYPLCRNGESWC